MPVLRDPYLQDGPLPPLNSPARPLTDDEEDAAEQDAGRPARTYAPASARVPKPPAPGHEQLIEEGLHKPISPEAASHPGDRSDPREFK